MEKHKNNNAEIQAGRGRQEWERVKKEYAGYLSVKNYSKMYIQGSMKKLDIFHKFIVSNYRGFKIRFDIKKITAEMIEKYMNYLIDKGLKYSTVINYVEYVKTIFKYLVKKKYILFNPADRLEMPRREKRLPKNIPTIEEMRKILNKPDVNNVYGLRDKAVLELLYSTGIRRDELRKLNIYDIDLSEGYMRVQGKGKKERVVPVGAVAIKWVEKYINEGREKIKRDKTTQALFLSQYGERISYTSIGGIVRRYAEEAGYKFSVHSIRHAFASHLMKRGAGLRYIQEMLGHNNISTTQVYTEVVKEDLRKILEERHPEARGEFIRFGGGGEHSI